MNIGEYQIASELAGDSEEDSRMLRAMALEARSYIESFDWCPSMKEFYFVSGIGGIIALFLAEFDFGIKGVDKFLWIVVGDIPSAYLVADLKEPAVVYAAYCKLMEDWVEAVESGGSLSEIFPADVPPTLANAALLKSRITSLRARVLPYIAGGGAE